MSLRILTFLLLFPLVSFGQSPADWWYFGDSAGVHFTTTGPVAVTDGKITTLEGCAAVSDLNGNLLFYSDGIRIWDANHQIMPNGGDLLGDPSSTQSGVIVPYPGNPDKFFVFGARGCSSWTASSQDEYYFSYSVVDMNLNGGMGDVLVAEKNIILFDSSAEKCTATIHANGTDIWVIAREQDENDYYAFHLSPAGIIDTVITQVGSSLGGCAGYLMANHAGDQIVSPIYQQQRVEILDFDQNTGVLSSPDTIDSIGAYGAHFSPNDDFLYLSRLFPGGVFQYDLNATNIQASAVDVSPGAGTWGAIAEGPDQKLYLTKPQGMYLARINDPNVVGLGCNPQDSAVFLLGRIAKYGLPNNVSASVFGIASINFERQCVGDSTYFYADTLNVDSVKWTFGDPTTGSENTSELFNPVHLFSDTGYFTVTVLAYSDTLPNIDTAVQTIYIYPRQTLDLGPDSIYCFGDTILLDPSQPFAQFEWSDSSTADTLLVWEEATIWVTLNGVCDTLSDTVIIEFDTAFTVDLGPDTTFCQGNSIHLDADVNVGALIYWNTGDSLDSMWVRQTGEYIFSGENACGFVSDSINVTVIPVPDSSILPPDTINCFDNSIVLFRPENDSITFYWSDSSSTKTYTADSTESVWLSASNECGDLVDTINIVFNGEIQTELGEDTTICEDDTLWLVAVDSLATYSWNTGSSSDSVLSGAGITKNYILTITLRDCEKIEQRNITSSEDACPTVDCDAGMPNVFTPNGDGINDLFRIESNCKVHRFNLAIYNRWGQMIHYSNNASYGWDGFINGLPAQMGTYFYRIELIEEETAEEDWRVFQGSFTLRR